MEPGGEGLIELDALCRRALRERRVEAFDNVDIEIFLVKGQISPADALWIGRHMMLAGRSAIVYREGQEIARRAKAVLQAIPA